MSLYQAESFYRARLLTSITALQVVPITVRVSTLPVRTNGLLTLSSNTEYEEICEFDNPDAVNWTIDIIKRGISPSCIALTVAGTDYNNPTYYRQHTANETIRGDVNHIHINQGIGNSTLATEAWVGIVRLSTAAVSPTDPIVVGDNDARLNPQTFSFTDANWFDGTVTNPSGNPSLELAINVSWVLKGSSWDIVSATSWTDFYWPWTTDVPVTDWGTWVSSLTAFAPVFWGTTSTSPVQSGVVWTTWDVLTSNWAWALPTFQTPIKWRTTAVNTIWAPATAISGVTEYGATVTFSGWLVIGHINSTVTGSWTTGTIWLDYSPDNSSWTTIMSSSGYAFSWNNFSAPVYSPVEGAIIASGYIRAFTHTTGGGGSPTMAYGSSYFKY